MCAHSAGSAVVVPISYRSRVLELRSEPLFCANLSACFSLVLSWLLSGSRTPRGPSCQMFVPAQSVLSPHPCLIPVSHGSLDSRVPCFGLPTVQLSSPTTAPAPGSTGMLAGPRSEDLDRVGGGHRQSLICLSGSPRSPQCPVLRLGDERDYMGPGQTIPNCPNSQVMSQCSAKSYRREMRPRGIGTFCLTHSLQVTPITPGCGLDPVPPKLFATPCVLQEGQESLGTVL